MHVKWIKTDFREANPNALRQNQSKNYQNILHSLTDRNTLRQPGKHEATQNVYGCAPHLTVLKDNSSKQVLRFKLCEQKK